ncbi:hypothetical protein N7462_003734 [Penicillium macrosclerotiorum]|uniref:uncharacterized protein n=1 Tax=Penicillium macrosclerotiorum TaxID=303699 RepID=UPI0025476038|nr:uncharacterized protein N7462_003734 [Penicillium macrosclerotiorum]KAJ5689342.1 hypothetical protein N7462_003734 [Penicillium macrosclerotiorum]
MEPNMSVSPLVPAQPFASSPSSPRKRSIHEVEDVNTSTPVPKRALTGYVGENQENHDPALSLPSASQQPSTPDKQSFAIPSPPTVEIPVRPIDQNTVISVPLVELNPSPMESPNKSETAITPASKKRKLSPASKEAKEKQKLEEKAKKDEDRAKKEDEKRAKADEKKKRDAEREEEKRIKDEEKKKRETEREEKKKAKEEEKAAKEAAKEEEKRRKEEEKLKKERAQPKLNAFFAKPRLPSVPGTGSAASPTKPTPVADAPCSDTPSEPKTDYQKAFPDFFLQSHTVVAPPHRFERDSDALCHVCQTIDASLNPNNTVPFDHLPFRPSEIFHLIPYRRRRGRQTLSVKEILLKMQNADPDAMDVDGKDDTAVAKSMQGLLNKTPIKTLRFGEDVRPPYQGTFTRHVPEEIAKKLSRNPYHRALPETNYEYDSEAEWEEPEEGEDLDSEEEEEASDDGEDDMDGFLDDEDDALVGSKRRLIVGELEPVCSGIQWAANGVTDELKAYRIETISDAVNFPINPHSDAYWEKPKAPAKRPVVPTNAHTLDAFRVKPGPDASPIGSALPPAPTSKAKRPFPSEHLEEFKQAVEGSDLSKIGLIEILKKRFPKVSKDTLKATLDQVAVRVGQKEVDKKWVCR